MQIFTSVRRLALFMLSMVLSVGILTAQERTVSGKVTAQGEGALPGVNVYIQGTTVGTITDLDGAYSLQVPGPDAVLVYSSVGFKTSTVTVGSQSVVDVVLVSDVTSLQEVVVTGYTSQSKRDITGAVASVNTAEMVQIPAPNVSSMLQGRVAGVMIGQDNTPGGEAMVRIRGFGTINNNDPLYIIDGVPTTGGLNQINPENIESVQILKDASAASIYGARAANGVIVITTKKGKPGATKITFDARYGIQSATNSLNLLNSQGLGQALYSSQRNDYIDANGSDAGFVFSNGQYGTDPNAANFLPDYIMPSGASNGDPNTLPADYSIPNNMITHAANPGTDWYKEIFTTAPIAEVNLGASGGSQNGTYYIGLNYFKQDGIVKYTGFNRMSIRTNTEFSPKKWLRVGERLEVAYSTNVDQPSGNDSEGNAIANAYRNHPLVPIYDIMGNWAGGKGASLTNASNPLAMLWRNKDNVNENWRTFGSAYIEIDLFSGLTFKSQLGIDAGNQYGSSYSYLNPEVAEPSTSNGYSVYHNNNLNWTWYNTLNYSKTFADIHRINVLVGTEAVSNRNRYLGAGRINYYSDAINYRSLSSGGGGITNYGGRGESSLYSLFGKLNYVLADKYLVDITIRRDGSSRFGPENRYALFPAFSVGWRLSQESFMSGISWLTDFKIRGGWGQMGNQDISNENAFTTFRSDIGQSYYDIKGNGTGGIAQGFDAARFGNPAGKWETTTTTNAGFDATIANKLTVNFDWWDRKTTDMLYILAQPGTRGTANLPYQNVGEMNNKGIDLMVGYNGSSASGDFKYNVSLNWSHYKNEVVKISSNANEVLLGPDRRQYRYTRSVNGKPLSSFYGLQIDGFTDGSESYDSAGEKWSKVFPGYYNYGDGKGRFKYRDVNGDGVLEADQDRTFIGNPHPMYTYGLNLSASYKGFDFTLFFQGVQGNDVINYVRRWTDFNNFQGNRSQRFLDESWTPALGNNALLPILSQNDGQSQQPSTYFVEKGSYFRCKNIQLGYTIPNIKGIDRLRVYVQSTNLFTITKYSGLDPEINIQYGENTNIGWDEGLYPTARTFIVGVNFGL